jgi:hypothetical protein
MKRIIGIAVVAAMVATSAFAVDIAASIVFKGALAGGTQDSTHLFGAQNAEQKDADLLQMSISGDKAGASFRFFVKPANESPVKARYLSFWFKPVSAVKVTLGSVDYTQYTEKINWWKVPTGQAAVEYTAWTGPGRYSSSLCGSGYGYGIELFPVSGLSVGAAAIVCTGSGDSATFTPVITLAQDSKDNSYGPYGAYIKYVLADTGVSVTGAWRDNGKDSWKMARFGADLTKGPFYGFVDGIAMIEGKCSTVGKTTPGTVITGSTVDYSNKLSGISVDNYFSYNFGAVNLQARFPVTLRLLDSEHDPSYMTYCVKASFPQNGFTPFLQVQNIDTGDGEGSVTNDYGKDFPIVFKSGDASSNSGDAYGFNVSIQPGVAFNVGIASLDIRAVFDFNTASGTTTSNPSFVWSVPVVARVSF